MFGRPVSGKHLCMALCIIMSCLPNSIPFKVYMFQDLHCWVQSNPQKHSFTNSQLPILGLYNGGKPQQSRNLCPFSGQPRSSQKSKLPVLSIIDLVKHSFCASLTWVWPQKMGDTQQQLATHCCFLVEATPMDLLFFLHKYFQILWISEKSCSTKPRF